MADYTKFTKVQADEFKGTFSGSVTGSFSGSATGSFSGSVNGKTTLSKAADYTLTAAEAAAAVIGITLTAASKTVTLGLAEGQVAFIINEGGTNAFTAKNVSGDSGTSIAAGKVALVIGGAEANATKIYVLN